MSLNDTINEQISYVENLLTNEIDRFGLRDKLPSLRLFLISHSRWLRVYNGRIERSKEYSNVDSFVANMRPDRGDILNFFSKVEFLVNELI
jgi:hypothetical protein